MLKRLVVASGVCVSLLVACGEEPDAKGPLESDATGASLRAVDIIVSGQTSSNYEARSYPNDDFNADGSIELYTTPVYDIFVEGVNAAGVRERRSWKGLRFMPFYNDPKHPVKEYKTLGFVNSGLRNVPRQLVPQYKPDYEVHNRFSEFGGAIVVKGSFYIHAGPADISDFGWGAAGCVEVLGNFDNFKKDILELAGSTEMDLNKGVGAMVAGRKLFVQYEQASSPDLKAALSRQVGFDPASGAFSDLPTREGEE